MSVTHLLRGLRVAVGIVALLSLTTMVYRQWGGSLPWLPRVVTGQVAPNAPTVAVGGVRLPLVLGMMVGSYPLVLPVPARRPVTWGLAVLPLVWLTLEAFVLLGARRRSATPALKGDHFGARVKEFFKAGEPPPPPVPVPAPPPIPQAPAPRAAPAPAAQVVTVAPTPSPGDGNRTMVGKAPPRSGQTAGRDRSRDEQALEQAILKVESGEPGRAIYLLDPLVDGSPEEPPLARYYLIVAHCQVGQGIQATALLNWLDLKKLSVARRYALAVVLDGARQTERALEIYNSIAHEDPNYTDIQQKLTEARHTVSRGGTVAFDEQLAKLLDTRYLGATVLGAGGMGIVFRAQDTETREEVAIKMLSPFHRSDPGARERFLREATTLKELDHPSVVRTHDIHDGEFPYYSMEFLQGKTLATVIEEESPIPIDRVRDLVVKILEGIEYCHARGVLHRDIKPQNILALDDGGIKIIDFGLVKSSLHSGMTQTGMVMGTPVFMSPEQQEGKKVDERADLYSVGVVLYQMLTGRLPFKPGDGLNYLVHKGEYPPVSSLRSDLPPKSDALIARAIHRSPEKRFESAKQMRLVVDKVLAGAT